MSRRNDIPKIIGLLILCHAVLGAQSSSAPKIIEGNDIQCSPDLAKVKPRVFAEPGLKGWKEFPSVKDVPPLADNGEQSFSVLTTPAGRSYVVGARYSEDTARFEGLCFDETEKLVFLRYE